MRTFRKFLVLALLTGLCSSVGAQAVEDKKEEPKAKPAKKLKGRFTIGKETTYVTGPVDKDGYINYAAAVNKKMGEGVTPQNNAVVLLWKAHGPRPENAKMPAEFFQLLGIERPPDQGDYFISFYPYVKERLKLKIKADSQEQMDEWEAVNNRPWKARDHKNWASWLTANEKPIALVTEASRRSHYFSPLVPGTSAEGTNGLISALLPGVQSCREFANALRCRAMLRLGEGDPDAAWDDLLACHRLGRLVARGNTLIENLVGIAICAIADDGCVVYLDHARPDGKKLESCLRDLRGLLPLRSVADIVDQGERFMFLDCVMLADRRGPAFVENLAGSGRKHHAAERWFLPSIDWDPALRSGNVWFDRLTAAMRLKDRAAREAALDKLNMELRALKVKTGDMGSVALGLGVFAADAGQVVPVLGAAIGLAAGPLAEARGKLLGDVLVNLLVPAVHKVQGASDRSRQKQDNLQIAFALAWYQRDQGRYPEKLEALAPKYLKEVPQDMFAGKPLVYRPTEKGYLLYSVGVNGKDEGGRSYGDHPPGDDLKIRMPVEQAGKK